MLRRLAPWLVAPVALAAPAVLTACSGGGSHKTAQKSAACPLIAELDRITAEVQRADVSDPVTFKRTLDDAVARYVATVDRLEKVAPAALAPDLEKVAAAVHQYRFDEAATDRASLDSFAASECGRTAPAATVPELPTIPSTVPSTAPSTIPSTAAPFSPPSAATGNTLEP